MPETHQLQREFDYYLAHQEELAKKYEKRFVLIKDEQIAGSYETELLAVIEGRKRFKPGTFLVQRCELGKDSYTQTFHSRVVFG